MNKRGFTLVELLAVIIIISLLALLTSTSITKMLKDAKNDLSGIQIASIKAAAESWGADNLDKLPESGECKYITLEFLKAYGVLDSNVIDPKNNETMSNDLKIKISATTNSFGRLITDYEVNPENVTGCSEILGPPCTLEDTTYGEEGQIGAKYHCDTDGDGTKDNYFYLLNNSAPYNLIMDRNYTDDFVPATMDWCKAGGNNSCNHDNLDQYIEHIEELWTNVDSVELPTANQIAQAVGNTTWDSTNTGSDWFYFDSKTQTQTATSKGASSYAWLFDYTRDCESYGCNVAGSSNYGYWTSSSNAVDFNGAWNVYYLGRVTLLRANLGDVDGIRPVITISNLD